MVNWTSLLEDDKDAVNVDLDRLFTDDFYAPSTLDSGMAKWMGSQSEESLVVVWAERSWGTVSEVASLLGDCDVSFSAIRMTQDADEEAEKTEKKGGCGCGCECGASCMDAPVRVESLVSKTIRDANRSRRTQMGGI